MPRWLTGHGTPTRRSKLRSPPRNSGDSRGSRSKDMHGESSTVLTMIETDVLSCPVDAEGPGESREANKARGRSLPASGRRRRTMKTFEFSIVASGLDPEAEGFADRFYDAGCS